MKDEEQQSGGGKIQGFRFLFSGLQSMEDRNRSTKGSARNKLDEKRRKTADKVVSGKKPEKEISEAASVKGKSRTETITIILPRKNIFVLAERAMDPVRGLWTGTRYHLASSAFTPTVLTSCSSHSTAD